MAEQALYKCDQCDYTSKYNHNILRHKRSKHRVEELPSDYDADNDSPNFVEEPETEVEVEATGEEEEGITYNDLEAMIGDKINEVLKGNNLPQISKKTQQSAMKTFMSGSTASLLAGMCLGYLLTANAPVLMAMLRGSLNSSSPASVVGGIHHQQPSQAQAELMRKILAQQQQQMPQQPPQTQEATSSAQREETQCVVSQGGLEDCLASTL
jgi:hypothetical protein